jgi:ankyrin repeat protein
LQRDKMGNTPVTLAVMANKTAILAAFQKYGIDISSPDHSPSTPPINPSPS